MNPEDMSFTFGKRIIANLVELTKRYGRLIAASWFRIQPCGSFSSLAAPLIHQLCRPGTSEAPKISWSDAAIGNLRLTSGYFDQCTGGIDLKERFLSRLFSTVKMIGKHPDIGRSGRVRGTKVWDFGGKPDPWIP
jgi:hypothetical protein